MYLMPSDLAKTRNHGVLVFRFALCARLSEQQTRHERITVRIGLLRLLHDVRLGRSGRRREDERGVLLLGHRKDSGGEHASADETRLITDDDVCVEASKGLRTRNGLVKFSSSLSRSLVRRCCKSTSEFITQRFSRQNRHQTGTFCVTSRTDNILE